MTTPYEMPQPHLDEVLNRMTPLGRSDFDRAAMSIMNEDLVEEINELRKALELCRQELDDLA